MRTRWHRRWLPLAAAGTAAVSLVASLAGCGVAQSRLPGTTGGHGARPTASPARAGDIVSTAGYAGPVMVSADGRTLTVGGFSYPCFGRVFPVASETAARVGLWLRYVTPVLHGVCRYSMAMASGLRVRLPAPLGGRPIVDGASGRSLDVFDERQLLRPSAMPRGYRLAYVSPVVSGGNTIYGAPPRAGCTQAYLSATAIITIVESTGSLALPELGGAAPAAIQVRGRPGRATPGAIMWHEQGLNILITASFRDSPGPALSDRALIAVADSAPSLPPATRSTRVIGRA
jgi:hypothetical protein